VNNIGGEGGGKRKGTGCAALDTMAWKRNGVGKSSMLELMRLYFRRGGRVSRAHTKGLGTKGQKGEGCRKTKKGGSI